MRSLFVSTALAACAIAATPAVAATTQIYTTAPTTVANQQWGGTLGLDFQVNKTIYVTGLGSFDTGKDGITNDIYVGIFDAAGVLLAPAINLNGTANPGASSYVTVNIAKLTLLPGLYQLASWGYNSSDANYNNGANGGPIKFNTLGGALTAIGTRYGSDTTPGVYATNGDTGTTRYGAGTLVAYVPEPATWAMMIGGFGLVGAAMRRRSKQRVAVSFA